jgi:hypothetical protein
MLAQNYLHSGLGLRYQKRNYYEVVASTPAFGAYSFPLKPPAQKWCLVAHFSRVMKLPPSKTSMP